MILKQLLIFIIIIHFIDILLEANKPFNVMGSMVYLLPFSPEMYHIETFILIGVCRSEN